MSRHEDFERKINRSLNTMETKISYLHEGMRGLQDSFGDILGIAKVASGFF